MSRTIKHAEKRPKSQGQSNNLIADFRPPAQRSLEPNKIKKVLFSWRGVVLTAVVLLVILIIWALMSQSQTAGNAELSQVKSQVGKLMLLPKDEEPTLASVDDKTKLKDAFLAAKSENGDQILIYTKNQTVIIYRPSINKIVAVGSVFADPALPEAKGASLSVLNGSNDETKTKKVIDQVKKAYPDLTVTDGGKTNRQDFPNTIVIDNTDDKDYLVDALVAAISGKRGVVPLGESKGTTDLLIIVGIN